MIENVKLVEKEDGLHLVGNDMDLYGDFSRMLNRIKPGKIKSEMIVKASKIKDKKDDLIAIDATAGMGEDSLLLAAAGFNVKLYEKDHIIFELLKDTIKRAREIPDFAGIVDRMEIFEEDSIEAMKNLDYKPDVILLDPMFPEREKSALIKKKFQLLQQLEAPCTDEKEMIEAAKKAQPKKIVVKRPLKGPFLNEAKPLYSIKGKAIRYDVYM